MPYRSPSDPRMRLPLLDRVAVATPCTAKWEDMVGSDTARFCCICSKTVHDLSAMDAVDAEAFLAQYIDAAPGEMPCTRFYRRADGRILTSECAPAARRRHAVRAGKTIAGALAAAAIAVGAADVLTRPTLAEDTPWPGEGVDVDTVLKLEAGVGMFMRPAEAMGGLGFEPPTEPPIDEGAIAADFEPESEVLGTATRTARVLERRRVPDAVLTGNVKLRAHRL